MACISASDDSGEVTLATVMVFGSKRFYYLDILTASYGISTFFTFLLKLHLNFDKNNFITFKAKV